MLYAPSPSLWFFFCLKLSSSPHSPVHPNSSLFTAGSGCGSSKTSPRVFCLRVLLLETGSCRSLPSGVRVVEPEAA